VGIAVLLLIADVTTGAPEPDTRIPAIAWGFAAMISLCGATMFAFLSRTRGVRQRPYRRRRARARHSHR
jgi:hypothetical protein